MTRAGGCLARAAAWLALLGPAGAAAEDPPALDERFARGPIVIESSGPACWGLDVWLARTPAQRQRGLMYVEDLPKLAGMLFVYEEPGPLSMWMKNTFIPLDILFVRGDGSVSSVARNTEPLSLVSIAATEPVQYVLELNAGTAAALHIDGGSRLLLPGDLATAD